MTRPSPPARQEAASGFRGTKPPPAPLEPSSGLQEAGKRGSSAEVADRVGISPRSVNLLAEKGVIRRGEDGLFDLRDAVRDYCAHLREAKAGRSSGLAAQRERVAAQQEEALRLKNEVMRGELVRADDMERAWSAELARLRARLLAVPSRVPGLAAPARLVVDAELRLALTELADGG